MNNHCGLCNDAPLYDCGIDPQGEVDQMAEDELKKEVDRLRRLSYRFDVVARAARQVVDSNTDWDARRGHVKVDSAAIWALALAVERYEALARGDEQ